MKAWRLNSIMMALALAHSGIVYAEEAESTTDSAEDNETEVISVTGVQYSDQKARLIERDKKQFSTVISTDDLGNFVDQNVAESLRRMPGVTLQRSEGEGKFVTVRGLGPDFVSVNMNGASMAGAGDQRKVGLDALAGDSLGQIEVVKTLTPDMNLNSIGGAVNVKSISAYDRGKDTLKLKVQNAYSDLREENSPKISIDGTQFLFDKKVGLGFVLSTEERKTQVNERRHHSSNEPREYQMDFDQTDEQIEQNPVVLGPRQLENRQEIADRERHTAGLNIEIRPDDANQFYINTNYVEFSDHDVALREFFDYQDAGNVGSGEMLYVNPEDRSFIVSDIDVFHQYFVQGSTKDTLTINIGGKHLIGDAWTFDYDYTTSKAEEDSVGDHRVQFRERDLIVYGRGHKESIDAKVLSGEEAASIMGVDYVDGMFGTSGSGDASQRSNWNFDNLFLEDSVRTDDVSTFSANIKYDFLDSDWLYYVKAGVSMSKRTHETDKDRWSFEPKAEFCDNDACAAATAFTHQTAIDEGYVLEIPANSDFQYPFVSEQLLQDLVALTEPTKHTATAGESSIDSTANDYKLSEDVKEAYIMTEMELADRLTLITGVRYVETEFASTGFMSLENDDFQFVEGVDYALDIFIPMPESTNKYSEFFPSAHLRYEPTDDLLVRAAIWTSYTRPNFKDSRGYAKFDSDIELCPPGETDNCDDSSQGASVLELQDFTLGANNMLDVGNPNLVPMTSVNYDMSVSWYESEDLFIEAAVFYKDIDKFIAEIPGREMSIAQMPLTLPINQVTDFIISQDQVFTNVNITENGQWAKVYGIELSYNQFFDNGLFIQSNATFQTSKSKLPDSIRRGTVSLPEQADITANFTLGWENDDYSARVIANYRSDVRKTIGYCPTEEFSSVCKDWYDQFEDDLATVDFKAKAKLFSGFQLYFDAVNLTNNADLKYFEGNELSGGNMLYQREEYGRTFQVGFNYKFY
ncbi:TonB-dependent receptor [Catenovulum agarivorans]|uniref:TonB-dependent receptor n=1 Tax=Catenovulum agarivorans TaxID=1172192 RepID=UPI000474B24D|nr:TonB-dependent receptor [Catenovulum agarivorans]